MDALLVGATPSELIASYVEHGISCGALCIDTTLIRLARALNTASAERLRVLLGVLLRVAPALARVRGDESEAASISSRYIDRCSALGELFLALLQSQSPELPAVECVAAAQQLADERSIVILMAAGAQVVAPHARNALLLALPRDSTLRRLWTMADDADVGDAAATHTASTSSQPLASRVALSELCVFSPATQSVVVSTPSMAWRNLAPPAPLTFVLDRLMCRIVATDESPIELLSRDLHAAFSLSNLPLATFDCFVIERMLELYRKSTTTATLALVFDVFEAACSASAMHLRVFYGAACEQFVSQATAVDPVSITWPDVHAYVIGELALMGASSLQFGRPSTPLIPLTTFNPTKEWFAAVAVATEHGVSLQSQCVDEWIAWLDADGIQQLSYDEARAAQMSLVTCVAADSDKRRALADAVITEVRRAVDTSVAVGGVMLALLANAAADTPLYELLRQAFRLRQLVEALVYVCNSIGNDAGSHNDASVDVGTGDESGGNVKRRRVDSLGVWSRFSDAFLLLYRLHARAVDDSYAGAFTMVRGTEQWNAAFGAATAAGSQHALDASKMSVGVWARATGFHVPMWEVNDAVDANLAGTLGETATQLVSYLFAPREVQAVCLMPPLSPWSMLLAVPAVMEKCVVQLATGTYEAQDVAARVDQLCQRCPCLMPAVVSWLADAALVRTNRWLPLAPEGATGNADTTTQGRSVASPPNIPQTRLLGELSSFHVASMIAAVVVLSTSPTGALMRRISVTWQWKPLLRARSKLDDTQTLALSMACGRRGLSPSQSVVAAKATAGIDPGVIRLFYTWLITRADTGVRWVRVGWVGDVLVTCRAVARGTSPRVVADWLIAELCKNVVSQQFSTRQQTAWFADITGVVLCNLSRESLCEWLETAVPSIVDRCAVAVLPLLARALCVACVLSDTDAAQVPAAARTSACAVLARLAMNSFVDLPSGDSWRTDFPVSNRDQVARVLLNEFVVGGVHGALSFCDADTRRRLLRCALAAHLEAISVCRLFAACDALNGGTRSPEASVRHTFTLLHCLRT